MISADGETLVMYAAVLVFVSLLGVYDNNLIIKILATYVSRAGSLHDNHVKASTHALESVVHFILDEVAVLCISIFKEGTNC